MKNKQYFLDSYQQLSPLEAFGFAHEVALQLNHAMQKRTGKELFDCVEPSDLSYSINQAFELMALSLMDYLDDEEVLDKAHHNENSSGAIRLKEPLL